MKVQSFKELLSAINNIEKNILITRSILCNQSLLLPEGTILAGQTQENGEIPLLSFENSDGLGITSNNTIKDLNINAPSNKKAIFNSSYDADLGIYQLENLNIVGQISIITREAVEKLNVIINNISILHAECRHYLEQPQKYGVNVIQGALTIYNLNPNPKSLINVEIKDISIGQKNAPVSGSGIFIAGYGDQGGKTFISLLQTKSVYSNGKIPNGVSDYITGGVFVLNGAKAKKVITDGEIVTYGTNDMVLDVWGEVDEWISNQPIISYGPSGVGFVNFGIVNKFTVNAPLKTFGLGARGYNQYDGTVNEITFKSIETFGDGSVGIQISKKIGMLTIKENVTTHGSIGSSLVKGIYVDLPAYALSIKDGGEVEDITINGNVETFGDNVTSYITEKNGVIRNLNIKGEIIAKGKNSNKELIN